MKLGVGPATGKVLPRGHSVVGKERWFLLDASLVSGLFAASAVKYLGSVGVVGGDVRASRDCMNHSPFA